MGTPPRPTDRPAAAVPATPTPTPAPAPVAGWWTGGCAAAPAIRGARWELPARPRHAPVAAVRSRLRCHPVAGAAHAAHADHAATGPRAGAAVRGDGTGNRRGGQQQCQQQCRVVVVVQRPQPHRDQQGGDEQPETRGQHIAARAAAPLRQRFGPARTCQQP
ncbi:hypothetical protein G6F68_009902 [Rhizopus microsporus]|nr:hypothetical protein G6F68_009902 [Rhizopus microsporus]